MKAQILAHCAQPIVTISANLYSVLEHLLKGSSYHQEFTVLTYCDREGDEFHMHTPFIPSQTNSITLTEFESDAIIDLMTEEDCDISRLTGHMHSHVHMDVSPSGTDRTEIEERAATSGFSCSIIMNKRMEIFAHICDYERGLYYSEVPVQIGSDEDRERWKEDAFEELMSCNSYEDAQQVMEQPLLNFDTPISEGILASWTGDLKRKCTTRSYKPYKVPGKKAVTPNFGVHQGHGGYGSNWNGYDFD